MELNREQALDLLKKYNKELCQVLNLTPPEGYVAIGE